MGPEPMRRILRMVVSLGMRRPGRSSAAERAASDIRGAYQRQAMRQAQSKESATLESLERLVSPCRPSLSVFRPPFSVFRSPFTMFRALFGVFRLPFARREARALLLGAPSPPG